MTKSTWPGELLTSVTVALPSRGRSRTPLLARVCPARKKTLTPTAWGARPPRTNFTLPAAAAPVAVRLTARDLADWGAPHRASISRTRTSPEARDGAAVCGPAAVRESKRRHGVRV